MNYNEENKIIAPLVWNNGKRELYDDNGNRLYTAEEVNQILNSEITPILNDRNWFAERCRILENYINQYTTIGLSSVGNYNQMAAQQNANNEFFNKIYFEARKEYKNLLDAKDKDIDIINNNYKNDLENRKRNQNEINRMVIKLLKISKVDKEIIDEVKYLLDDDDKKLIKGDE